MGYNISGLAINKNYEQDFDKLQEQLGWNLVKQADIDFETASENWTEDEICNVYFTENGTLLFMSMEMCDNSFPLKNDNSFTFILSEGTMAFKVSYSENGELKRYILEDDDGIIDEEGDPLAVEEGAEDTSEVIWAQIEQVIGQRFWDIEPDAKAVQYVFAKAKEPVKQPEPVVAPEPTVVPTPTPAATATPTTKTAQPVTTTTTTKKWWEFWK